MKICQKLSMCFAVILICSSISSLAQSSMNYRDFKPQWEINLNGGLTQFYGDLWNGKILPNQNEVNSWRYGKGLILGRQISPIFGIRLQAFMGEIDGEKKELSANFITDIYEFNLHSSINLSNLFDERKVNRTFNFYAVLGYGLVNYKTSKYLYDTDILFNQKGIGEGKGIDGMVLESAVVAGLGLNVKMGDHWGFNLESSNRLMLSDMIDLTDNSKNMDVYNYTSIGLQYRFGNSNGKRKKIKEEPFVQKKAVEKSELKKEVVKADEMPQKDTEIERKETIDEVAQEAKIKKENQTPVKVKEEAVPAIKAEPKPKTKTFSELEYRVQIRACHNCKIPLQILSSTYGLDANLIKEDKYGAYHIYTVGSYPDYQKANEAKMILKQKNGVLDAFIVAFRNGQRLRKLPE